MSYYLEKSKFGYSGKFSINNSLPVDLSIKEYVNIEHKPISPLKRGGVLEFAPAAMNMYYCDLSKTRLRLSYRIIDTDTGNPITGIDEVGPVNYTVNSIFRQIDFSIQQRDITSGIGTNYPYKAIFDLLTQQKPSRHNSVLQPAGVYFDTPGYMDSVQSNNSGLFKRSLFTAGGNTGMVEGPLHFDGSDIKHFLPNGLAFRFRLYPARDEFTLMSAKTNYALEIVDATLQMTYISPSSEIILAHNKAFENSPALYTYMRSSVKSFVIPSGLTSWSIENLFTDSCPSELIISIVRSKAHTGDFDENPFNFETFNLNHMEFAVEGHMNKSAVFSPDYVRRQYTKEYLTLFNESNDYQSVIDFESYVLGYAIYRVKVDDGVTDSYRSMNIRAQTRLSLRFGSALSESVTVMVYGRFPSTMQIDKSRNIYII